MIKPKFTVGAERLHISDKYLCNGHWIVTRNAALSHFAPKALKPLLSVVTGTYYTGVKNGRDVETCPDMDSVVGVNREGYLPLSIEPVRAQFSGDMVNAYVYKAGDLEVGVNPDYVPLLAMGTCFSKDKMSPILILDGKELTDTLLGVLMPMRLNDKAGA